MRKDCGSHVTSAAEIACYDDGPRTFHVILVKKRGSNLPNSPYRYDGLWTIRACSCENKGKTVDLVWHRGPLSPKELAAVLRSALALNHLAPFTSLGRLFFLLFFDLVRVLVVKGQLRKRRDILDGKEGQFIDFAVTTDKRDRELAQVRIAAVV